MMQHHNGFILLLTLIMLSIMTLIGLATLNSVWFAIKQEQYARLKQLASVQAENGLKQAENQFEKADCIWSSATDPNWWELSDTHWWENNRACHYEQSYYYIILLQHDDCASIPNQTLTSVDYYQITSIGFSPLPSIYTILQSIIARPSVPKNICIGKSDTVMFGRQTWHEKRKQS